MQNPIFHEAATLIDKVFWEENHYNFKKVQNFEIKNYRFFNSKQEFEIFEK